MSAIQLKPLRLLLLGAPGSGKGTQTSKLLKHFAHIHPISSGDILRREIADNTELGKSASQYIAEGKLLPDKLMSNLVTKNLRDSKLLNAESSWLLDGFPRTLPQAKLLRGDLELAGANLNMVVELKVPESVILERIENRWVHVASGRIYNLQYNPPKTPGLDDITGEKLTKRPDDNPEVFQKRLDAYNETLKPLKEFYQELGILHTVEGETSDIIFPKLSKMIEDEFALKE